MINPHLAGQLRPKSRLRMRHTDLAMWPSIDRPSQGVRREIRRAEARYGTKIKAQLTTNNTREVW